MSYAIARFALLLRRILSRIPVVRRVTRQDQCSQRSLSAIPLDSVKVVAIYLLLHLHALHLPLTMKSDETITSSAGIPSVHVVVRV